MGNSERLVSLVHAKIDDAPDARCDCRIDGVDSLGGLVSVEGRNQEQLVGSRKDRR